MSTNTLIQSLKTRMTKTIENFEHDLLGLRTGRASVNFLDPIVIKAYENRMPINQLATISTPDARTIVVQVWDNSMVKPIEKAIVEANLGLTPAIDGQLIRLPVPALSEERRHELVKLAHKYAENTKISVRNIRRDGVGALREQEKNKEISEDEYYNDHNDIQKLTDEFISKIDKKLEAKEQDILTV